MLRIELNKLKLENFKGVKNKTIDFSGVSRVVLGTNETGKSTVFDAFLWLLFDKNSQGKSQFGIKTLDEDNNVIHNLNHIVEGEFNIKRQGEKNEKLTLKKDYHEVWTRKRGTADQEFNGHTTDYYINDEPVKKSEYEEKVSSIIDEDLFKLVTDPLYFSGQLHWSKQREILFDMVNQPEIKDIADRAAKANKSVNADRLVEVLRDKDEESYKKTIKSKMKKINDDLDKIPARIDEVNRNIPDTSDYDKDNLESQRKALEKKYSQLQEEKANANSNSEKQKIQSKINDLQSDKRKKEEELISNINEEIETLRTKISDLKDKKEKKERENRKYDEEVDRKGKQLKEKRKKREELLAEYHSWEDKEFDETKAECPVCEQALPEEQVEEHRQEFNKKKSDKMEEILSEGKSVKAEIEEISNWIETNDRPHSQEELEGIQEDISELEQEKQDLIDKKLQKDWPELEEYDEKIAELQADLDNTEEVDTSEIEQKLANVGEKLQEVDEKLAEIKAAEKSEKRLEELQEEEQELVEQYNELETKLFELEEYIKAKINLMEGEINSKFEQTNWKLFEKQVNGALNETCEALRNGVPYDDMNTGGKFKTGMDIIKTLSRHYQVQAPVFIDNRERVAELPEIESQTVHLVMSPHFDELEVKTATSADNADEITQTYGGLEQEALF